MPTFCLKEAARAKNGPVYLLQLVLTLALSFHDLQVFTPDPDQRKETS